MNRDRRSNRWRSGRWFDAALAQTRHARVYKRALALRDVERGASVRSVAEHLRVSRSSIYAWRQRYAGAQRLADLDDAPRSGRPMACTPPVHEALKRLLAVRPRQWGAAGVNWTLPLLQAFVEEQTGKRLSQSTLRRCLHRWKGRWKRPKYVLAPDPALEKKTPDLLADSPLAPRHGIAG